jgi:hypothetical protein
MVFLSKKPIVMTQEMGITKILCKAIQHRQLLRFYYGSEKSGKKEWRTVEPYIVGIYNKGQGNTFLAALPTSE